MDPHYRAISPPNRRIRDNSTPTSIEGFVELERHSSRGSINFSYPMNARPNSPSQSPTFGEAADPPRRLEPSPTLPNNDLRWKEKLQSSPGSDNVPLTRNSTSPDARTTSSDVSKIKPKRVASGADIVGSTEKQPQAGLGLQLTNDSKAKRSQNASATDEQHGPPAPTFTPNYERDSSGEGSPQSPSQLGRLYIPKKKLSTMLEVDSDESSPQLGGSPIQGRPREAEHGLSTKGFAPTTKGPVATRPSEKAGTARDAQHSPGFKADQHQQSPTHKETQANALSLVSEQAEEKERSHSLSPTRSTRFSRRLEVFDPAEPHHEPPPRSKSPAKSALKPATSSQATTPNRVSVQPAIAFDAPSETSEGTSVLSEDGLKKPWKKRAPKVSFEDETEIIDHPQSPPTSPESYTAGSPQFKGPAKAAWRSDTNWSRPRNMADQDDLDGVLKPRPILPSFGSIRGGRPSTRDSEITPRNVDSTERTTQASAAGHSFSTDGVIGGILSNHQHRTHQIENDDHFPRPLPPEVTSVNGAGYTPSSADSSSSDEGLDFRYFPPRVDKKSYGNSSRSFYADPQDGMQSSQTEQNNTSPPAISVQPPTPAMEETKYNHELDSSSEKSSLEDGIRHETQVPTPQTIGAASYNTEGTAEAEDGSESDETGDSIYSDAVEDISDLEGDGFGSIDAVVDTSSTRRASITTSHNHTHAEPEDEDKIKSPSSAAGNVNTSPIGNAESISEEMQQIPNEQPPEQHTISEQNSFQKQAPTASITVPDENPSSEPKRPTEAYDSSVLSDTEEITRPRYTDSSKIINQPMDSPTHTNLELSTQNRNAQNHNDGHIRRIPQRTRSQGSDSSSSFRRMRPARQTGRYSLKRTMRNTPGNSDRPFSEGVGRAGTFAGHAGERRPMSSGDGRLTMRTTMRQRPASSRRPSFGGFGKRKSNKSQAGGSEFHSRYAESSDDELRRSEFRPVRGIPRRTNEVDGDSTDLEDSSDNEPRNTLRRTRTGKSPSKVASDPAMAAAMAHVLKNKREASTSQGANGKEASDSVPLYTSKPRGGLFSRLKRGRRNDESSVRKSNLDNPARMDTSLEKSRFKRDPQNFTPETKGTSHVSISGPPATEPASTKWRPVSPRLHKRLSKTGHRTAYDSWPSRPNGNGTQRPDIGEVIKEEKPQTATVNVQSNGHRPHTSDGVVENGSINPKSEAAGNPSTNNNSSSKPNWTSRFLPSHNRRAATDAGSISASDIGPSMGTRALRAGDKRARFPMLKKAFGLGL